MAFKNALSLVDCSAKPVKIQFIECDGNITLGALRLASRPKPRELDITDSARTGKALHNIAIVAACPFPCARGTPVRVARMAEALAELGHKIHVVTYHLGDGSLNVSLDKLNILRTPNLPFYRKLTPGPSLTKLALLDPMLMYKLFGVVRKHKIDFVYAHHYEALIAALLVRSVRRCPVVYDAHTMLETELPDYVAKPLKPVMRKMGGWLDRAVPKRADHVVAVSQQIADDLSAESNARDSISVISNGLELNHFMACPWSPDANDRSEKVLIFTGNLASYQGIELMLSAFAELRQRRKDILLRIITDDDFQGYRAQVDRLAIADAVEVKRVDFDLLPRELAMASIALNPRLAMDGIPQKLLNYMAVGVPVVSFAGSARNLIDGKNARVVPDGDTGRFAAAIDELLNDARAAHSISQAARQDAQKAGTWLSAARKLERVFSGLID